MEFRNFKISKCAFHQIFQRVEKDKIIPPYYSDSCEDFDEKGRNTLRNRINKAFGNDAHSLKMEIMDTGEESVYRKLPIIGILHMGKVNF